MAGAGNPVGRGLVESLARPGGNTTGFEAPEYSVSGKFLELLKEIAPLVTRAAVILGSSEYSSGILGAIQAAAASFGVELRPIDGRDAGVIERDVAAFASRPNGGLLAPLNGPVYLHRELIIKLADRHRLPAVYPSRVFVADGGLISYGPVRGDLFRRVAGYVDRIL
jgi:putative tryptophan/tyrosine transport system substrate-binding protein